MLGGRSLRLSTADEAVATSRFLLRQARPGLLGEVRPEAIDSEVEQQDANDEKCHGDDGRDLRTCERRGQVTHGLNLVRSGAAR